MPKCQTVKRVLRWYKGELQAIQQSRTGNSSMIIFSCKLEMCQKPNGIVLQHNVLRMFVEPESDGNHSMAPRKRKQKIAREYC